MTSNKLGIFLSAGLIIASGAYAYAQSHPDDEAAPIIAANPATTAPALPAQTAGNTRGTPAQSAPPAPAPAPKPSSLYKDGTYTGPATDAYYGTVQVEATIRNGKVANVAFLQYPSDRSTSRYINGQAMPMLTQEAIQAQSANVDIISGATATSEAFIQSLTSALAQARA